MEGSHRIDFIRLLDLSKTQVAELREQYDIVLTDNGPCTKLLQSPPDLTEGQDVLTSPA